MFNWFRRQFDRSQPEPEPPVEEAQQPTETEPPQADAASEEYLNWAKSAFQNIQQQKAQATEDVEVQIEPEEQSPTKQSLPEQDEEPATLVTETEPEAATQQTEVESVTVEAAQTPNQAVSDMPMEPELKVLPEEVPAAALSKLQDVSTAPQSVPAWMQKSNRLEILKETAIETEEETQTKVQEEIAFDEEFVWSAKVLAQQGRSPEDVSAEEISWLKRLRQGLGKTRRSLVNQLKAIVGQGPLNQDAVMEIEALLLQADVGIEATDYIIDSLQNKLREQALPPEEAISYLKTILRDLLDSPLQHLGGHTLVPEKDTLNVWLLTGVNGAGKTTTIGKLAHLAQKSGYSCLIAAADTFRAAAVEQVKVWGERSGTLVVANPGKNTDPAAVVYDGIAAAQARNAELLLVDTAGRLQNKKNLMEELTKIRRIIDKKAPDAKVESLLVLDATLGQNGLRQAQVFSEAAKLSGVVLTKLDGSAKGGVALAVAQQLDLPIRFIGAGEGIEDLRPFSSYEFVEALLSG